MSTPKVILLKRMRERERDPKEAAAAQRRSDLIQANLRQHQAQINSLAQQAVNSDDPTIKFGCLRAITDILLRATKGKTPCANGCSHCCYQPVMITQLEADIIGREIGRAPAPVAYHVHSNEADHGTPCPLLKKGKCSIYASRPIVCRTHISVANDEGLCQIIPGESIRVPYYDARWTLKLQAEALGAAPFFEAADLREFFPDDRKKPDA